MLLTTLRKDMMMAKKEKDTVKANLLSTLVAEAVMIGKNDGNRETTEPEIIKLIGKFIKSTNENISILQEAGKDCETEILERDILSVYLPKQMSDDELRDAVSKIIDELGEKSPKMMGAVMGKLKAQYEGQYDGKSASGIVKSMLS